MPISFNEIPANPRVPFVYVEFDASKARQGPAIQPYKVLVIGQRLAAGTVAELIPRRVTSADQAAEFFGAGSMLHGMATALFKNNRVTESWFIAQDDAGGGVKATGSFVIGGSPTAAGTLYLYVAGRRLQVAVATTDTPTTIGDAVAAAINADTSLPATAANVTGTVTLTARNAGEVGNDIDLRGNYYEGEVLPAGVTLTVNAMSGGSGNPDITSAFAVLGDEHYNLMAVPWRDSANLTALDSELADRWGPLRQIEGVAMLGARGSHGTLITLGDGQNSKHFSILGANLSPTPTYEWAAAAAGLAALHGQQDPARPFQTLELKGVLPPAESDRFDWSERNLLLQDGISTFTVDAGGKVRVERLITTYQENAQAQADDAFLDVNTPLTLGYLRYDLRNHFLSRYPRHKLGSDGTRYGAGQAILTPLAAKGEVIGKFRQWAELALVEGPDQFAEDLIVERNISDPNRLDIQLSPDLVNQLRVVGAQIAFLL